jgi:multidrug transporter EmrE-like cation transporter
MAYKYVLIFLLSVFIASVSQILLKKSANKNHANGWREYLNKYVIIAYFIFFISTILTIIAYKGVELKYGPIIESVGYIFILIMGKMFLNEKITKNKMLGILLIIIGVCIFSL